jgi:hypothetical protein
MASQQGKAFCVLRFEVYRSMITAQREFRALFKKDATHKNDAIVIPICCLFYNVVTEPILGNVHDSITITILDIIHLHIFYSKLNLSDTIFCLGLQRQRLSVSIGSNCICSIEETIQFQKLCVLNKKYDDGYCPKL